MPDSDVKSAVVTGGGSGIGSAVVDVLRTRGWRVAVLDLEGPGLAALRQRSASEPELVALAVDVTDEQAVEAAMETIETSLAPIHGVVNSAGIAADRHMFETPVELFRKILDVNVVGTFVVARAAARRMAKRKRGAIVNLSSISGMRGNKGRVAYGASKGAVITLTQVMANELGPAGIRVNAVAPGPTETAMVKAMYQQADRELWTRYVPLDRFAAPVEVAQVIAFLLDEGASSYVNGAVLPIDGGLTGAGIIVRHPLPPA